MSTRSSTPPPSLLLGVVSGDPSAKTSADLLCAELAASAGVQISARLVASYSELADAVAHGAIHVAWAPPLVALDLDVKGAAVVVVCSRRKSGATYNSVLFARRDAQLRRVEDIRGRSIAWVSRQSLSGHLVPRAYLLGHGIDPDVHCVEQKFYENHSDVARAVLSGACDVGATFANLDPATRAIRDAGWNDIGAGPVTFEALGTTGPIPADAMVVSTRLNEPARSMIAGALVDLPSSARGALRALLHADGFERPQPEWRRAFEGLRGLPERIRASQRPPPFSRLVPHLLRST